MPALPDPAAEALPAPQPATGVANIQPPSPHLVGHAGAFLERAGGELEQASNVIRQTNAHYDTLFAEDGLNQLRQRANSLEYGDPQSGTPGFRTVSGANAIGEKFSADYQQRLKDATSDIAGGLQNDQQRQLFQQRADVLGGQFQAQLLSHQAQQSQKFADATDDNAIKTELSSVATDPYNEMGAQSSLARINGIFSARQDRTGEPQDANRQRAVQDLFGIRTHAMMNTNPYAAEKFLEDHLHEMGVPGIQLQKEVQREVQQVQSRDVAQRFIFGNSKPLGPTDIAPGAQGAPPLQGIVAQLESGDRRFATGGRLVTSPRGAQGEMQVMPPTAADPGYGVKPAQDDSPEEKARVGRDYLGAMTARYQDPALVLAAYNAGPTRVDKWLTKYGDPRTGQVSSADWAERIPFAETKAYVQKGLGMVGDRQPGAMLGAPTAKELKTQLPQLVEQARRVADQMYPNDPIFADSVASRVATYGNTVVAGWTAQQDAARDMLTRGLVGTQPDGSDKPLSIDALLQDPRMKEAWRNATPEVQLAIQNHFKDGEPPRTPETTALWYQKVGEAQNDRDGFAEQDLSPLIGKLPHAQFDSLVGLQMKARNKSDADAEKQANMLHAMSVAETYVLKPMKIATPTANTPADQRALYDQFTGAFTQAVDQFQQANGKPPADKDLIGIARNLTTTVTVPGRLWGTKDIRAFQITPENVGDVRPKAIPPAFMSGIVPALTRANGGKPPTQAQIDTAYLLSLRATSRQAPVGPASPAAGGAAAPTPGAAPGATGYAFPQNAVRGTVRKVSE